MTSGSASAFAAVDLGASSGRVIRGVVGRDTLELTEVARFRNGPVAVGSRLHWDILGLWQDIVSGLRQVGDVRGIGIDSWAVDYGLVDRTGLLLGNPRNYRDPRTEAAVAAVAARMDPAELYRRNGLQRQPFNTIFQLVADQQEPLLPLAEKLLLIPDLLGLWLTGQARTEVTNASTTGLLDPRTRAWAPDLIELAGIGASLLPPLVEPGETVGTLQNEIVAATGLAPSTAVVAVGSHDTASAVVGVPARDPRFAYISCGTWSLVGVELTAPVLTTESFAANFTNELGVDGTVRYLSNVMGLWLLAESIRTWEKDGRRWSVPELIALAGALPAGGPVIDPDRPEFLSPGDMPSRIAAACEASGQQPVREPAAVVRCIVDSLADTFARRVAQAQQLSGQVVDVVHIVGGGSQNALLCQLTADAVGLPVLAGPVEATALGNLLVQGRAAGALDGDLFSLRDRLRSAVDVVTYFPRS